MVIKMIDISLALGSCCKRYLKKELRKIRKFNGRINRVKFGGKYGCSVILFDMPEADYERYRWYGLNRTMTERQNEIETVLDDVLRKEYAGKMLSPTDWRKFYRACVVKALARLKGD